MFEMKKTKNVQMILLIISCICIILLYIHSKKTYIVYPGVNLNSPILYKHTTQIVLFITVIINIVIYVIRKDVEENLEALKKRFLDEIKKD